MEEEGGGRKRLDEERQNSNYEHLVQAIMRTTIAVTGQAGLQNRFLHYKTPAFCVESSKHKSRKPEAPHTICNELNEKY